MATGDIKGLKEATGPVYTEVNLNNEFFKLSQTTPQTIADGRPIFNYGVQIGTTSTGNHADGKVYYDSTYKTLVVEIAGDVSLQLGQEDHILVRAAENLVNGDVVYFSGASNGLPSATKAVASAYASSVVFGVCTQSISSGATGLITRRGEIHDIDTTGTPESETWTAGDILYLSTVNAGKMTNVLPIQPNIESRIGRILEVHASTGEIYVDLFRTYRLTDLADVTIASPTTDQVLGYNGSEWVNRSGIVQGSGPGIEFYNCTPVITSRTSPTGLSQDGTLGNGIQINSLSKTPVTTAEQTQVGAANNDTRPFVAWLYDTALSRTTINSGTWNFVTFAAVSSLTGTTTTVTRTIYQVVPGTGTLTFTGNGANSRTATISDAQYTGTYFAASATNTNASYIQATSGTNKGIYQITAMTDGASKVATVTVRTNYTNETGVTYNIWNKLFSVVSNAITSTGTNYAQYDQSAVEPEFTVATTDKLGQIGFVTSNGSRNITIAYNGTVHNTHFTTPLITLHNNLAGLEGGGSGVFNHLSAAAYTIATTQASAGVTGYLSGTDWSTFNSKQAALTFGIADTNKVQINSASVANGEYAKFTATGLEGRSYSEVLNDIGAVPESLAIAYAVAL
jgi:hypothetical protein